MGDGHPEAPPAPSPLGLDPATRADLWRRVEAAIEAYGNEVDRLRVAPVLDPERVRASLAGFDFATPVTPSAAVDFVVASLREHQVHTAHGAYYGLFNPAPTAMGVYADALAAAFNPQLAAWSHNPFGVETERHLVWAFAGRLGYDPAAAEGVFASGGMEANHTAVLCALVEAFPGYAERGARAVAGAPVLYVSAEGHDSLRKAARLCGLGAEAARAVGVGSDLRMDVAALADRIAADRAAGRAPFLVVATAGTTSSGVVDPIPEIADLAAREGLWLHVDAAWGGAAALVPELKPVLAGIERADSITFDAHKWLSVPMGAGMYLSRRRGVLERTFRVREAYMPRDGAHLDVVDPFASSIQWSRRFTGLKVFLSLAVAGWDGYAQAIAQQAAMGERLRQKLEKASFRVVNRTPLPLVCFVDGARADGGDGAGAAYLEKLCARVVGSGRAWISCPRLADGRTALRACITSWRTRPGHLDELVAALEDARRRVGGTP